MMIGGDDVDREWYLYSLMMTNEDKTVWIGDDGNWNWLW